MPEIQAQSISHNFPLPGGGSVSVSANTPTLNAVLPNLAGVDWLSAKSVSGAVSGIAGSLANAALPGLGLIAGPLVNTIFGSIFGGKDKYAPSPIEAVSNQVQAMHSDLISGFNSLSQALNNSTNEILSNVKQSSELLLNKISTENKERQVLFSRLSVKAVELTVETKKQVELIRKIGENNVKKIHSDAINEAAILTKKYYEDNEKKYYDPLRPLLLNVLQNTVLKGLLIAAESDCKKSEKINILAPMTKKTYIS